MQCAIKRLFTVITDALPDPDQRRLLADDDDQEAA